MLCHKTSAAVAVAALGALLGCSESEGCSLPTCSGLPSDTVSPKLPDTIPSGIKVLASFPGPVERMPEAPGGVDGGGLSSSSFAGIAVGPTTIAVAANDFLALYTREGVPTDAKFWDRLFAGVVAESDETFAAPTILYDERSGRFFATAMGGRFEDASCVVGQCVTAYYLAVSKTGNPVMATTADWHVYRFDGTVARTPDSTFQRAVFVDDPVVVVHRERVVISNEIQRSSDHALLYTELRILPLAPLLEGVVPEGWLDLHHFPHPVNGEEMLRLQPALMLSDHSELFLVGFDNYTRCSFVVWSVDVTSASPVPKSYLLDESVACAPMTAAPQPGGALPVDAGDGRVAVRPVFYNGRLWITRGIGYNFGSGPVVATLWAELDVSAWPGGVQAVQFGIYGEDAHWTAHPSIMINAEGDAFLSFNRMSREDFPSLKLTWRRSGDAPSTLRGSFFVKRGTAALNSQPTNSSTGVPGVQRFASRTSLARDPLDGSIWILGQYIDHPTIWKTWIANVR